MLRKYRVLLEPRNTPFECDDRIMLPVRRLWSYLVRQNHLMQIFIRHIFRRKEEEEQVNWKNEKKALFWLNVFKIFFFS